MKKFLLASTLFLAGWSAAFGQKGTEVPTKNGVLYFGFGTNLSWYTGSDIRFKTTAHEFTIYDVKAKDDGGLKFNNGGAAQYTYQVGYYFTKKKWGIEFNFDHIKYFVTPNQVVRASGMINGNKVDGNIRLTPDTLQFEHSDGANYALFNFVKLFPITASENRKAIMDLVVKAGAGPVFPKTNSTLLGEHYDDRYKISGYVAGVEAGLRFTLLKHFYVLPSFKGAYANYTNFVVANGSGSQKWMSGHFNIIVGGQINL